MKDKSRESATSIATAAYCARAAYIGKILPYGGKKSPNTTSGQIEHEYFEKYLEMMKMDSVSKTKLTSLALHEDRKFRVSEFIQNLIIQSHPEFAELARETLESLNYRSDIFFTDIITDATALYADGLRTSEVRELVFPWKIEHWFENLEYKIVARADLLYKARDGSLIVTDIKSHHSRIAALMHREDHHTQMAVYAILAEAEFNLPVNKCRIFYSQDMSYEDFYISNEEKAKTIELRNDLHAILDAPIPPLLEGPESFKCKYCYKQDVCSDIQKTIEFSPTTYTPPPFDDISKTDFSRGLKFD